MVTLEYPDQMEMRKNRLLKLKESGQKCEVCGQGAYCVHHIDGSRANHAMDNLAVLCAACHAILHNGGVRTRKPHRNKYYKEYGMTMTTMCAKYRRPRDLLYDLHKKGKLKRAIKMWEGLVPEADL